MAMPNSHGPVAPYLSGFKLIAGMNFLFIIAGFRLILK
jgi:hypothetical protein